MLEPDDRHMFTGAILTGIGSWMVIVPKWPLVGMAFLAFSNLFLVFYAVCVIMEYFRILLNPVDETTDTVE